MQTASTDSPAPRRLSSSFASSFTVLASCLKIAVGPAPYGLPRRRGGRLLLAPLCRGLG